MVSNLVCRVISKVIQGAKARDYSRSYANTHLDQLNYRKKQRKKEDASFRLKENTRSRIADYIRSNGAIKSKHTEELLQCSWGQFDRHLITTLEENEVKAGMDVDHIFPLRRFDVTKQSDCRRAFHWSNHQLLPHKDNILKKARLPTKAMASKVARWAWPDGVTEDMLPDIYDGWATPLRMRAPAAAPSSPPHAN